MPKNSENAYFIKPKLQSNLDILDHEYSNNVFLSMTNKGNIIFYQFICIKLTFFPLFSSNANKNISKKADNTKDQFKIFTKQNI